MKRDGIYYAADLARFNPKHHHAFLFDVERRDTFKFLWMRTAATYGDILQYFEAGLRALETCRHGPKRQSCPGCKRGIGGTNLIEVWYYVMTKDDVLFERHCYVRSVERAMERIESGITKLRALADNEREYCGLCGRTSRIR